MTKFSSIWRPLIQMTALGLLAIPAVASAHEIGQSNGVTVIVHVEPTDNPVAKARTELHLYYVSSNSASPFNVAYCDCSVELARDGHTVSMTPVTSTFGNANEATASVVFPASGSYSVVMHGRPTSGNFPTFAASVIETASAPLAVATPHQPLPLLAEIVIGVVGVLALVGTVAWQVWPTTRKRKTA